MDLGNIPILTMPDPTTKVGNSKLYGSGGDKKMAPENVILIAVAFGAVAIFILIKSK